MQFGETAIVSWDTEGFEFILRLLSKTAAVNKK